tara:strand:+ start:5263 stop:6483 length:1221 start_codon:yes stop_codon:yes gene_type:complete
MASLLDKVKAAIGTGTLMPDNYNNAISASRNDPEVISYLKSITPEPAPTSPVSLFNSIMPSFGGGGRTLENTTGATAIPQVKAPSIIPERFTKFDNRGLPPASAGIYGGLGNIFQNDPMAQAASRGVDNLNASQSARFQDWLKTPAGRMWETSQSQGDLRRATPLTPLGDSFLDPEVDKANDAAKDALRKAQENIAKEARERPPTVPTGTEKTEDLTPEAKTFNTAATVVSPSAPEKKQDWFNAVNDRIDLMAMGAAMLAGSGQRGATTMSRLGEGLQAGLASRAAQAKDAENKQYRDAVLLLQAQKARATGLPTPFKDYGAKINDISSFLSGSGFEGDNLTELSRLVHGMDTNFVSYPAATKKLIADEMAKEGSNWFSSGGELSTTDVEKTYLDAKKAIAQRLSK